MTEAELVEAKNEMRDAFASGDYQRIVELIAQGETAQQRGMRGWLVPFFSNHMARIYPTRDLVDWQAWFNQSNQNTWAEIIQNGARHGAGRLRVAVQGLEQSIADYPEAGSP